MIELVSIDPGVRTIWTAFWSGGVLVEARGIPCTDAPGFRASWVWGPFSELAIEVPQIYQGGVQAKDQQDLIDLAIRVGWCEVLCSGPVTEYLPRQWKGNTPKNIHNKRIKKVLTPGELLVLDRCKVSVGKMHNVLDAVGIGLKHLGREYKGKG